MYVSFGCHAPPQGAPVIAIRGVLFIPVLSRGVYQPCLQMVKQGQGERGFVPRREQSAGGGWSFRRNFRAP